MNEYEEFTVAATGLYFFLEEMFTTDWKSQVQGTDLGLDDPDTNNKA